MCFARVVRSPRPKTICLYTPTGFIFTGEKKNSISEWRPNDSLSYTRPTSGGDNRFIVRTNFVLTLKVKK